MTFKKEVTKAAATALFPQIKTLRAAKKATKAGFNLVKFCKEYCCCCGNSVKMKKPMKIGICSGVTMVVIILIGWVVFPRFVLHSIKKAVTLKNGNDLREMYIKTPFPLVFKIYLFNVTNPEEVTEKGATPIVNEMGPYIYDEWKEKIDVTDDEEEDTLTYFVKNTFIWNEELTEAANSPMLTGEEVVTIPHPLIAGLFMAVEREKPAALNLIVKAVNSIHKNPKTPFLTTTVNKLLFDGVEIDCHVNDFAGKALCSQLKEQAGKDLHDLGEDSYAFSMMGMKNATKLQKIKVYRGIKKSRDVGKLIELEDKPQIDIWSTEECNTYQGTDTTIFPPLLKKEEGLISFAPDLCRVFAAYYVKEDKYAGIKVRRYTADLGDQTNNEEDKCYCPKQLMEQNKCWKKGLFDLGPCVGMPMIASLPHFFKSDPEYVNGVRGLNPNEKEHDIEILFEWMTGAPVSAKKRLQFSMPVHPFQKVPLMKNMPDTVIPLMWVEEGVDLNKTWTGPIKKFFTIMKIMKFTKYIVLISSLAGIGLAIWMNFKQKNSVTITPVKEAENDAAKNISMLTNYSQKEGGHINSAMSSNEIDKY